MLAVLTAIFVVKSLIIICPPNRVAIISGGRSNKVNSDGRKLGYRTVKGGRTLRIPLLEQVSWMDLNNIPLEVSVTNAYSKGAIPLNVQGIANVKVSSQDSLLSNSVERFLNVPHQSIAQIAKETLEANLRGVLATLTPEEVNEDRLKFCREKLGVEHTIKVESDGSHKEALEQLTGGDMCEVVFDATGHPGSMSAAPELVAFGGTLVFVGVSSEQISIHHPTMHRREMTLMSSRNAVASEFGQVMSLMESGKIDTNPWITHRSTMESLSGDFPTFLDPTAQVLKAMVHITE